MSLSFTTAASDPATIPTGTGNCVAFSPDNRYVAIGHATTPFLSVYAWDEVTGFGARVTDPVSLPAGAVKAVAWSPDGTVIAATMSTSPFVNAWAWSAGAFGSKYSNPATLPPGTAMGNLAWHPSGAYLAVCGDDGGAATQFMQIYPWSSGFGAAINPDVLTDGITTIINAVAWSPDGNYIAAANSDSPFIRAWAWTGSSLGTIVSAPGTGPTGTGRAVAWSPDGTFVSVGHSTTPFMTAWPWSAGFGAKLANPVTLPPSQGNAIAWSPDNANLMVCHTNTPFLSIYPVSGGAFGTKLADPVTKPAGGGNGGAFDRVDPFNVVVANNLTPFVRGYVGTNTDAISPTITGGASGTYAVGAAYAGTYTGGGGTILPNTLKFNGAADTAAIVADLTNVVLPTGTTYNVSSGGMTIQDAMAAASSGDKIVITGTIATAAKVVCKAGVSVYGSTNTASDSVLISTLDAILIDTAFVFATGAIYRNFTIQTNGTTLQRTVGCAGNSTPAETVWTDVVCINMRFVGNVDVLQLIGNPGTCKGRFYACAFVSGFDCVQGNSASGQMDYIDCTMNSDVANLPLGYDTSNPGGTTATVRCISAGNVVNNVYRGSLTVGGGSNVNACIKAATVSAKVHLFGPIALTATGTNHVALDNVAGAGTFDQWNVPLTSVNGIVGSAAKPSTSGAFATRIPSGLTSPVTVSLVDSVTGVSTTIDTITVTAPASNNLAGMLIGVGII